MGVRLLLVSVALCVGHLHVSAQLPPSAFDRDTWEADYAALKLELERSYSHLAWFGSPESGVDLPQLERGARDALRAARNDSEAADAIRRFIAGFRDGHLAPRAVPAAAAPAPPEPPVVTSANDARTACAAFGYVAVTRIGFSLPFESLPGFELVADGAREAFRSGILTSSGIRIGVVRIPRFRQAEFASVCERAWRSLRSAGRQPTRELVNDAADDEWLRMLAERLRELKTRGAAALVVDIGGNGGGNDLGDWAVRLFSSAAIKSAPMLLSAGPVAIPYFDEQIGELRKVLEFAGLSETDRLALQTAIGEFERRKTDAGAPPCDMSWVWREQRSWGTSSCTRLIASGFASGALEFAERGRFAPQAAHALYWASHGDEFRGAWDGPTYVLTNGGTGSAAEMFAALIRDRGVATIVGTRTFGLGCGFLLNDAPFVLPRSHLAFSIPNCVRLRADGTDDVAGVVPDIPLDPLPGESARSLAWRTLQAIVAERGRASKRQK